MTEEIYSIISEITKKPLDVILACKDDRDVWDSMSRVEVLFALEDTYDIFFDEEELADLTTPAALCEAAEKRLEKK